MLDNATLLANMTEKLLRLKLAKKQDYNEVKYAIVTVVWFGSKTWKSARILIEDHLKFE